MSLTITKQDRTLHQCVNILKFKTESRVCFTRDFYYNVLCWLKALKQLLRKADLKIVWVNEV